MEQKSLVGIVEKVVIFNGDGDSRQVHAKIDTGATKSSIDINLASDLKLGPIMDTKIVKSASGTGLRPIIMVDIEVAGRRIREEFTLADRTRMKFPVLIGMNILKLNFLIDPMKK